MYISIYAAGYMVGGVDEYMRREYVEQKPTAHFKLKTFEFIVIKLIRFLMS